MLKPIDGSEPILIYRGSIPLPSVPEVAQRVVNVAHGYEDGQCNYLDEKGEIVAKKEDPELSQASYSMKVSTHVEIWITLHKNGSRTFSLDFPAKGWKKVAPGCYVPRWLKLPKETEDE